MKDIFETRQVLNLSKMPMDLLVEFLVDGKLKTLTVEAMLKRLGTKVSSDKQPKKVVAK